jgi:hypothetical protein
VFFAFDRLLRCKYPFTCTIFYRTPPIDLIDGRSSFAVLRPLQQS